MGSRAEKHSIELLDKPETGSLQELIDSFAELQLVTSISRLLDLAPDLETSLSYTGERLISHPVYSGTASLNTLGYRYLNLGHTCSSKNAPLATRLQHLDLAPHLQRLYSESSEQLGNASIRRFLNGCREMTIGCSHCLGVPSVVIPGGDRADNALYFEEDLYKTLWGKEKSTGSISWYNQEEKKMVSKLLASRDQLERAISKGEQ